jgi:hypothetical protein
MQFVQEPQQHCVIHQFLNAAVPGFADTPVRRDPDPGNLGVEWQYGYNAYTTPGRPLVAVPASGYYVTAAYFLTGEHIESRTMIKPRWSLILTNEGDFRGPDASELAGRVSELSLGEQLFSCGFADPTLGFNLAVTTDLAELVLE